MPRFRDDDTPRSLDDLIKYDDDYRDVAAQCITDDDKAATTCWSGYKCERLHKLDTNYKCAYKGLNGTSTTYCCANDKNLCCEPDSVSAGIAAMTGFSIICFLLWLTTRYWRQEGAGHTPPATKRQGFQILTQAVVPNPNDPIPKAAVMATGFE